MYTYYKEVQIEEHMLYASEIATMYGICLTVGDNKPHAQLVTSIIDDYVKAYAPQIEPLFYRSKFMARVYPEALYLPAIYRFFKLGGRTGHYNSFMCKRYEYKLTKSNLGGKDYE